MIFVFASTDGYPSVLSGFCSGDLLAEEDFVDGDADVVDAGLGTVEVFVQAVVEDFVQRDVMEVGQKFSYNFV